MPEHAPGAASAAGEPCAEAAACCDAALRGYGLTDAQRTALVLKGLDAADRALALSPGHFEAITVKVLLLRLRAGLEPDPSRRAAVETESDALRQKAVELQKIAHSREPTGDR